MKGFGWNFYGFFVVSACWIAFYFCWAQWMTKREQKMVDKDKSEV